MGSTLWAQTSDEEAIATINIAINYIQTATEGDADLHDRARPPQPPRRRDAQRGAPRGRSPAGHGDRQLLDLSAEDLAPGELRLALLDERGGASPKSSLDAQLLLRGDLLLQSHGERRLGRRVDDSLGERRPRSGRRPAARRTAPRWRRRARPRPPPGWRSRSRSASSPPISRPVRISSLARPTPTTLGRREHPPTSGIRPRRVSGRPTRVSSRSRAGRRPARSPARRRCTPRGSGRSPAWASPPSGCTRRSRATERAQAAGLLGELAGVAEVDPRGEHRAVAAQDDDAHPGIVRPRRPSPRPARARSRR